jgi:hypothetical protein
MPRPSYCPELAANRRNQPFLIFCCVGRRAYHRVIGLPVVCQAKLFAGVGDTGVYRLSDVSDLFDRNNEMNVQILDRSFFH